MITQTDLKIKEYKNEIDKINEKYKKNEPKLENITKGSLIVYGAGAVLTPYTIITNHPHISMITAGITILSLSVFSLSLCTIASTDKKINILNHKVKELEKQSKSRNN